MNFQIYSQKFEQLQNSVIIRFTIEFNLFTVRNSNNCKIQLSFDLQSNLTSSQFAHEAQF